MRLWCVKVSYYYAGECCRDTLETDVKLFESRDKAVKALEDIIRHDWMSEIPVDGKVRNLADCRGMPEDGVAPSKYSDWYYSEDGEMAWCFLSTGSGYKGEVVEIKAPVSGEEA